MSQTVLVKKEHYRPLRQPTLAEWTRPALLAALFAGAGGVGVYLLWLGAVWASAVGLCLLAGSVAGALVLYVRLRSYPQFEIADIQEFAPVEDERRIPVNVAGQTSLQPVVKGIFTQAEFASMSVQAEASGRLTRSAHGFSGERYQQAYEWLLERGFVVRDSRGFQWTRGGFAWLEIPLPRLNSVPVSRGDDDDDRLTEV